MRNRYEKDKNSSFGFDVFGADGKWIPNYGEDSEGADLPGSTMQVYYKSQSVQIRRGEDGSETPVGSYNGTCYEYKDKVRNGIIRTFVTNEGITVETRMCGSKENMEKGEYISILKIVYSRY